MKNIRELGTGPEGVPCCPSALVNALGSLLDVSREQEFVSWLSSSLTTLVPGGPFFCGIGAVQDGMVRPRKLIHIGFPADYLRQHQKEGGVACTPFVRKALNAVGLNMCADLSPPPSGKGGVQQFEDTSDTVAMVHADSHIGMVSFLGRRDSTKTKILNHERTLSIVMPVLHATLLKIAREEERTKLALDDIPQFTAREAEVAHWMMMGKSNWSIATILETGESSVKAHLRSIFSKLGVNGRTQAAAKLAALGQFSHARPH